jgi:hypothetical protein
MQAPTGRCAARLLRCAARPTHAPLPALLPPGQPPGRGPQDAARGAVAPSVSSALAALRAAVRAAPALRLRVLVTGSLYLVGDTLRALGRAPK